MYKFLCISVHTSIYVYTPMFAYTCLHIFSRAFGGLMCVRLYLFPYADAFQVRRWVYGGWLFAWFC